MAAGRGGGSRRPGGTARAFARLAPTTPLADAESEVADGSRRWPDSRQLALEAARIAAQREFYPQAVLRYQRALALPGPAAEAMGELAQTLVAQHRFAPAAALLDRLAAAEPDQPRWRESLARAAQEEGDVERALAHWRAIIDLVPKEMGLELLWAGCSRMQAVWPKPTLLFAISPTCTRTPSSPTASSVAWRCSSRASPRRRIG